MFAPVHLLVLPAQSTGQSYGNIRFFHRHLIRMTRRPMRPIIITTTMDLMYWIKREIPWAKIQNGKVNSVNLLLSLPCGECWLCIPSEYFWFFNFEENGKIWVLLHLSNVEINIADTAFILAFYKTEACKRPPRLCRQGYACPHFHNIRDKRRNPRVFKYRWVFFTLSSRTFLCEWQSFKLWSSDQLLVRMWNTETNGVNQLVVKMVIPACTVIRVLNSNSIRKFTNHPNVMTCSNLATALVELFVRSRI